MAKTLYENENKGNLPCTCAIQKKFAKSKSFRNFARNII